MYGKIGRAASEETVLELLCAKCLPVLLTEACPLLSRDKLSLKFTLTRLFMKIFRTSSSHRTDFKLKILNTVIK